MALQIEKKFVVNAAPSAVWGFLTDPRRVAHCLPGAAITEQVDERTYAGTITVKVGPVSASYKGKLRFERLDAQQRSAELVASGQEVRGKGGADMRVTSRLAEPAPGTTEVTATSQVNVTGILAQFGRGMIQDVSDEMFQKFTEAMRAELEAQAPPPATGAAPTVAEAAPRTAGAAPAAAEVAPVAAEAAPTAPRAVPPATAQAAPVDVLSLGARVAARAAGRTVRRPAFWAGVIALALILYWLLRRG